MLYPIDRNSRIPSIKAALQAAGLITTLYYENNNYIIFSCPRSNKIIKLQDNSAIYFGDAWTSTTVITNEISIQSTNIDPFDWNIVVTPDILAFVTKAGSGATGDCFSVSFGKSVDGSKNFVVGACSTNNSGYRYSCWDITSGPAIQLKPAILYGSESAVDGNGFYYSLDPYVKTLNGNVVYTSPVKGLKVVLNGVMSTSQAYYKFGNDLVVHGRWAAYNATADMGANFIILNGVI